MILIPEQNYGKKPNNQPKDLVNELIRFPSVRLIGPDGEQMGVMSSREAQLEANKLISYKLNKNNAINKDFALTEIEKGCFSIIMNILQKNNLTSTICRVAGGWVRDKLLGKESDDIDIALNDMKGSKLGSLINEELYPGKNKVGIIQQNVEKGKNLEVKLLLELI